MFAFKKIEETYSDPKTSMCQIGVFDGPNTAFADVVIEREGISGAMILLNSNVLREALLSNPKAITETCGVVVKDVNEYNKLIDQINKQSAVIDSQNEALSKLRSKKKIVEVMD